ncbi:MAG TPA: lysine 2,3-aminomutase [Streptosporangiaceae bacterium]|nr:lysine 2,3-aminomutase [Streptosporangiaceae bacterium]
MPSPVPPGPCVFTAADLDALTARAGLPPARREKVRAVAAVTGFGVTSYVADELIDWAAAPDDPLWRLMFPAEDMLDGTVTGPTTSQPGTGAPGRQVQAAARQAGGRPLAAGPQPGECVLPGAHRISHDTVLIYLPAGPGYGLACPGAAHPPRRAAPALAPGDVGRLAACLAGHPEVSMVEVAGDALAMPACTLRGYIEPLLAAGHLAAIQLPTRALACWPHRFLAGPDADDTLRLFTQATEQGTTVMLMACFTHPRELEPDPATRAAARVRATGAMICTSGPLTGTVNDDPLTWAGLWRAQTRAGMVPHAMTIQHITGPAVHYQVPLARAHDIFAAAYASVTGLARTVRGPVMADGHATICLDGTTQAGTQKLFVLRHLQARDPHLAGQPFFAAYDPQAAWPDQLHPPDTPP